MLDSDEKFKGECKDWEYPYKMDFSGLTSCLAAQLVNNEMEFDMIGLNQLTVVRCRQIRKSRWFSDSIFRLESSRHDEAPWILGKTGWMGVKIQCEGHVFKASYRKRMQVLDGKWKLELSRKNLLVSSQSRNDGSDSSCMKVALAYFLWVRYSCMCES
jgi:hypothetical protein